MLIYAAIGGLQPIPPGNAKENGVAAMLVDRTKEADDKPFVYVHQHGGNEERENHLWAASVWHPTS